MKLIKLNSVRKTKYSHLNLSAKVDDEDFERLNKHKWYAEKSRNTFYAKTRFVKPDGIVTIISMHREIMKTPKNVQCDHINHNGIDCQKHNLRNCTNSQNQSNRTSAKNSSSNFLGVHKVAVKRRGKVTFRWEVRIMHNGKSVYVGRFQFTKEGEIKAALAYNNAAKQYHGDFANLNAIIVEK